MNRMIIVGLALVMTLASLPVSAQEIPTRNACPEPAVGDSYFSDVDSGNPHAFDINCLAMLNVVQSGGAFHPTSALARWEMAEWMESGAGLLQTVPMDPAITFADTGTLALDTREAIEAIKMLGITTGVSTFEYDPYGAIPRWQMALFLTRFLVATGNDLPSGIDQGFNDLGGLEAAYVTAINQLRQLGITRGTSPDTFSPNATVTKEQMASFVSRTMEHAWRFHPSLQVETCEEVAVDGWVEPVVWCSGSGYDLPGAPFKVRYDILWEQPLATQERSVIVDPATHVEMFINGMSYQESVRIVELPGVTYKFFEVTLDGSVNGEYQADYYVLGSLWWVENVSMVFDY